MFNSNNTNKALFNGAYIVRCMFNSEMIDLPRVLQTLMKQQSVTRNATAINPLTGYNISTGNVVQQFGSANSMTNMVANGNFEVDGNGDGWADGVGTYYSTGSASTEIKYIGTKSQKCTSTQAGNFGMNTTYYNFLANHKYYISCMSYIPSTNIAGNANNIYIDVPTFISKYDNVLNRWNKQSSIATFSSDVSRTVYPRLSNSAVGDVVYYDGLMIIDLTATFGSGSEPNIEWCEQHINFFTGSQDLLTFANSITLNQIGPVKDDYSEDTGVYTKRISDWVTLDGGLAWTMPLNYTGFKVASYGIGQGVTNSEYVTKYDGTPLNHIISTWNTPDLSQLTTNGANIMLTVSNNDSGFSDSLAPSANEVKAYFNGWKMCHSDGTSPYLPSLVPYTPSTWAEWSKSIGVTADLTGINITNQTGQMCSINTNLKVSTKYGVLINSVSNTATDIKTYNYYTGSDLTLIPGNTVGNVKLSFTTASSIATNALTIYSAGTGTAKFKDIRIFELPVGSQIETDFNTLTADQLSAKYGFYGLCTKNWKKITDGTGLTSTLPTVSYTGYTPYKMIYQLATPVVTNIGNMVKHGGFGYIGGDTTEVTFDFGTKVAGSVAECPMRIAYQYVNLASLPNPTTGWTFIDGGYQSTLDLIKTQDNSGWNGTCSVSGSALAYLIELDLSPLANQLYGGSNSALESALKYIYADVWAKGGGVNGGISADGCQSKLWNGAQWSTTAYGNNSTGAIAKMSIIRPNDGSQGAFIDSFNKLYMIIHATYPSDGVIASSINLDYSKITMGYNRTLDTVTPKTVTLPKYWAMLVKGWSPSWASAVTRANHLIIAQFSNGDSDRISLWFTTDNRLMVEYYNGTNIDACYSGQTFNKHQTYNILFGLNANGWFLGFLSNNGTFTKVSIPKTMTISSSYQFYTLRSRTASNNNCDAFAGSMRLYDLASLGGRGGKNMIDMTKAVAGYIIATDGSLVPPDMDNYTSEFIPVKPNTTYTYYADVTGATPWSAVATYDINKAFIVRTGGNATDPGSLTFTTSASTSYVRVGSRFRTGGIFQLEEGSMFTGYEPYSRANGFTDYEAESILRGDSKYYQTTTSDFTGKMFGSVVENPNVFKPNVSGTSLQNPSVYGETSDYGNLSTLNGLNRGSSVSTSGFIPVHCFSFNLIEIVKRKYGFVPGSTVAEQVAWLKTNVGSWVAKWYGYGSCPVGNKAYLTRWSATGVAWDSINATVTASTPTLATTSGSSNYGNYIDNNGFIHILAYTDASNGTISSTINTDYVSLDVTVKTGNTSAYVPNKELFDINAVTLHANATMSNGVITLNATGAWQQSYVYTDVLPNNKYELNYTSTNGGYMVVEEYYNGVFIKNGTTVAGTFVTSPTTNKVKVRTSNGSTGVFTWTNISFKLKM